MDAIPALYGSRRPADEGPMSGRAWRLYLAGGLTAVALYFVLPLEGLWSSLAYDLIGLSSVAAILVAVGHLRLARPLIWWCFAAGQLLFVVGDMLYAVIDLVLHQSPFPSVADGFYLAGYPVLAAGLLILIRGRISGRDRAGLIDAAIIATGLGLLSWTFLMKPIAADPSLSLHERLISLAYPLGDVLLLALVARLATSPGARTIAYRLLGLALVLLLGADIGYAVLNLVSSYEGGLIDAGWLLSYVVWGTAALHPSMRSLSEVAPDRATRFSHRRRALLAATSLMAPAVPAPPAHRHRRDRGRVGGAVLAGRATHGRSGGQGPGPGYPAGRPGPQRRTHRDPQPAGLGAGAAPGDGPGPTPRRPAACRPAGSGSLQTLQRPPRPPGRRPAAQGGHRAWQTRMRRTDLLAR